MGLKALTTVESWRIKLEIPMIPMNKHQKRIAGANV